jgi:hypothetical protein
MSTNGDVTHTLLDAVYHGIGHLSTVRKDAKRLEKKTGCFAVAQAAPKFACCPPTRVAGEVKPAV